VMIDGEVFHVLMFVLVGIVLGLARAPCLLYCWF